MLSIPGEGARSDRAENQFSTSLGIVTVAFIDILAARARIAPFVRRTPTIEAPALSSRSGAPIRLKCEHHQATGSFKLRGATNAVLRAAAGAGVVTASTGNHGRALAHAAGRTGRRAIVCLSGLVPQNKVAAIRALGAEVRIVGRSQDDAQAEAERLARAEGLTLIPPFDHADIVAGQGTLGLELMEDAPETRTVIVPLSGGGLIAGVALAAKAIDSAIRVIGVTMERGAAMQASLSAGHPVDVEEVPSLADSLGGGIGLDNCLTFAMVRDLVDEVVLVTEAEIAAAIRTAYFEHGEVIEGAAAVGIAALDAGRLRADGPAAIVLSGKNIDMELHRRIVAGETPDLVREREAADA
jgi:threonine dehydratase